MARPRELATSHNILPFSIAERRAQIYEQSAERNRRAEVLYYQMKSNVDRIVQRFVHFPPELMVFRIDCKQYN